MKWEGLYVALSRVKFRDDIRLLLRNGDRTTMKYIYDLKRNENIQSFFNGYKTCDLYNNIAGYDDRFTSAQITTRWDGRLAAKSAGFVDNIHN